MKISPNYRSSDWSILNLSSAYTEDWIEASKIVHDRIWGRYIVQTQVLEDNLDRRIWEYSGFYIMSIACLVIETMNQFYWGIDSTNDKFPSNNKQSYIDFLTRSEFFNKEFNQDSAEIFYKHIRNGLLHQAQTKKGSLINIRKSKMITPITSTNIHNGIEINRLKFQSALVNEFESYIEKLQNSNVIYNQLRTNCIAKMKIICNL